MRLQFAGYLLICLEATKCVLRSVFTLMETICLKMWEKPLPKNAKDPLPVDVRHSKTPLLKLPIQLKLPRNMQMKKCSRLRNLDI